jgi:hypothetical protein
VRLVLVGKLPRRRAYFDALQAFAYEEGLTPEEVVFTGHVAHESSSPAPGRGVRVDEQHEGRAFVESMLTRVPVLPTGHRCRTRSGLGRSSRRSASPR